MHLDFFKILCSTIRVDFRFFAKISEPAWDQKLYGLLTSWEPKIYINH